MDYKTDYDIKKLLEDNLIDYSKFTRQELQDIITIQRFYIGKLDEQKEQKTENSN